MVAYTGVGFWRCRPTIDGQCETPQAVGRQPIQIPALFAYTNLTPTRGVQRHEGIKMLLHLIYGESYVGKTTTCRKLLKALLVFDATVAVYEAFGKSDFRAKLTAGTKTIGIYSAGYNKGHLRRAMDFGRETECDIMIGAVNYHTHYNELLQDFKEGSNLWWHTLEMGNDTVDKQNYSNQIVLELLNAIIERNNI